MASSSSVMAGLCLAAAPGYISLAVPIHLSHFFCTLFSTVPSSPALSQRLRILDKSRGLDCDPLVCESSQVPFPRPRPPSPTCF
jgi:hypothetical protein